MKNIYYRRASLKQEKTIKHPLKKLPPVHRLSETYEYPTETVEILKKTINAVDNEIEFYLEDANREISFIQKRGVSSSALSLTEKFHTKPSLSPIKRERDKKSIYLTETMNFPLKKPIKTIRKNTIRALFGPETRKDRFEKKERALSELKRELLIPLERAEDLYEITYKKKKLFENYRQFRHEENPEGDPNIFFIASIMGKQAPLPVLAHAVDRELILNRYYMSIEICQALSVALPELTLINHLHLDNCGISDRGGAAILEGLEEQQILQTFFYTQNEIGPLFALNMKKFLQNCEIEELNLRGSKTTPKDISKVISSLINGKRLKKLNLSEIGLDNMSMKKFVKYFKRCEIESVDLSWNQISEEASAKFFKRFTRAAKIKYLDYSWNKLSSEKHMLAQLLGKGISELTQLLHLNISFTKLSDSDLKYFFTPVSKSWTLLSLHLTGNSLSQSSLKQFKKVLKGTKKNFTTASKILHPMVYQKTNSMSPRIGKFSLQNSQGRSIHKDNRINIESSMKEKDIFLCGDFPEIIVWRILGKTGVRISERWNFSNHCWICERWNFEEVKLNLSNLEYVTSASSFKNPVENKGKLTFKCSHNYWEDSEMKSLKDDFSVTFLCPAGNQKFWFVLDNEEVCVSNLHPIDEWENWTVNSIEVPARDNEIAVNYPVFRKETTILKLFIKEKSVFAPFREDTEEYITKMFNCDKKYYKLNRMFKNKELLPPLHTRLLRDFRRIKEIYEYLAAISNYPTIGWLDFVNFCTECQFINNENLTQADVDRIFIAVNYDEQALEANPSRELCRYEFFEVLIRLAVQKYKYKGIEPIHALIKLMKKCVYPNATPSNAEWFRKNILYTYEVNEILDTNYNSLLALFNKFKDVGGRFLSLEGAKILLKESGIELPDKEVSKCYSFSKMSILDEMNSGGLFWKMQFVEMLEFIGRVAEKFVRENMVLHLKIEAFLEKVLEENELQYNKPEY